MGLDLEMAKLSSLAYTQFTNHVAFKPGLDELDYELIGEFSALIPITKKTEVFGFIAESQNRSVIVFRGTDSIGDFIADMQVNQIEYSKSFWWFKHKIPMVHSGFYGCFISCFDKIKSFLENTHNPLFITGHSLGASVAILCHLALQHLNPTLYTFAAPKIGNKEFIKRFALNNAVNIVNKKDIIPHLPPDEIIEGDKIWQYQSFPTKQYVDFQKYDILGNHHISNYIIALS